MGFSQGLSGLQATSAALSTTGNNIANAQTVGFKSARSEFAALFAGQQAGIGVEAAGVKRDFSGGAPESTGRNLDLYINGEGFFRLDAGQRTTYSRNGSFELTRNGYIVNAQGSRLTGYNAAGLNTPGATPSIDTGGKPDAIQVPQGGITAKATSQASQVFALDSGADTISANFDINDPSTFNYSSVFTIYDSQGNAKNLNMYFAKRGDNEWVVHPFVNGDKADVVNTGPNSGAHWFKATFNENGLLAGVNSNANGNGNANGQVKLQFANNNGAATPQQFTFDFTGSTQTAQEFSTSNPSQNGHASGKLTGINVSDEGIVLGAYSNGQSQALAQIALAKFGSNQGLRPVSGTAFVQTGESGQPAVGVAGSGQFGTLESGQLEKSNVDLAEQLVDLIVQQRNYQANAKTIKTQAQVLQTAVNIV